MDSEGSCIEGGRNSRSPRSGPTLLPIDLGLETALGSGDWSKRTADCIYVEEYLAASCGLCASHDVPRHDELLAGRNSRQSRSRGNGRQPGDANAVLRPSNRRIRLETSPVRQDAG